MSTSSSPMPSSIRFIARIAVRRRRGGQTAKFTSSPTPTPMPVSSSRESSRASSVKPVVSTTRAVVAMVVTSAPSHGSDPIASASTSSTATATVSRPSRFPTREASSTATTVPATCRIPREKVR